MSRRILVATDFSPASRKAFEHALALARAAPGQLLVAHVLPSVGPIAVEGYAAPRMYADMALAVRASAEKRLKALLERARRRRVRARGLLLTGVPHEALGRAARRERADLLVIGTHGRTGMSRLLMGSVAARVIGTAPCPVLTVRGR
jgi:universal stress protein A